VKPLFLGNTKPVIVQASDDIELLQVDYPSSTIVTARPRSHWKRAVYRHITHPLVIFDSDGKFIRYAINWHAWVFVGADVALKGAVIAAVFYIAAEVGVAFLPGGAVSRVLGGLR
jgi:hypothetical protein